MPADRRAPIFAVRDIKGAIDQDFEDKARAGAELQAADATLEAVAQDRKLHTGELHETASAPCQITTCMPLAVELNHECLPLTPPVTLSETVCVQFSVQEFLRAGNVALIQMLDDNWDVRVVL